MILLLVDACLLLVCWMAWREGFHFGSSITTPLISHRRLAIYGVLAGVTFVAESLYVITDEQFQLYHRLALVVAMDFAAILIAHSLFEKGMERGFSERLREVIASDPWVTRLTTEPLPLYVQVSQFVRFGEEGLHSLREYGLKRPPRSRLIRR